MYYAIYAKLNILCISILVYILVRIQFQSNDKSISVEAFSHVLIATIAILVLDTVWPFIERNTEVNWIAMNYVVNSLTLFDAGLISFLWFVYAELTLNNLNVLKKRTYLFTSIPLIILAVFCLSTAFIRNGLFYIDTSNVYHRGSYYFISILVGYGYLTTASVHAIQKIYCATNKWERKAYITLLSFFILPALGGIVTTTVYGLPAAWPAATFSLLMVFTNMQSYQISIDQLTGLNNRRSFDLGLASAFSDDAPFCMMMIDINQFKYINDTYGHVEGDRALRAAAEILRTSCCKKEALLYRFGGDEFAVILKNSYIGKAKELSKLICRNFDEYNLASSAAYVITVCIGSAARSEGNAPECLIAAADAKLYEAKKHIASSEITHAKRLNICRF